MLKVTLQGEEMFLLPEKALYWPAQKTLIVADVHWGKGAHFRKHGIPVPAATQTNDEVKLAKLVHLYSAERMIIAGDLFHSHTNNETEQFARWREVHHQLHIDFIIGNHDILPANKYDLWNLTVHRNGMTEGPFHIAHDIPDNCEQFCIHGHVHPAVRITRRGYNAVKLCCFAETAHRFILPAFGEFTGNYLLEPASFEHVYVIAGEGIVQWK